MDRGIPTEKVREQMRRAQPPGQYLVGTPRGRLSQYEQRLAGLPWQVAREGVKVKLLTEDQELSVLAESPDRVNQERALRRRQLKGLGQRLKKLQGRKLQRDALLKKRGAALHDYPVAARLIQTAVAPRRARLSFALRQDKQRQGRKREGRYLLRRKIPTGRSPEEVWPFYSQLTEVEAAFKSLKDDLALRPIHHQLEQRIQAPIFISFLACCLQVTLRHSEMLPRRPVPTQRRSHPLKSGHSDAVSRQKAGFPEVAAGAPVCSRLETHVVVSKPAQAQSRLKAGAPEFAGQGAAVATGSTMREGCRAST